MSDEAPGGLSWARFKEICAEVSGWAWGTVQGAFNEKASLSQIIVDGVIGMIPLAGDVTAARDLIAVTIGMINEPEKREDWTEWLLMGVLVFALIPVIGGVVKVAGRLVIKAMRAVEGLVGAARAAKLQEEAREVVAVLNRMGWKNAEEWFKALRFSDYLPEVLGKYNALMDGIGVALQRTLDKVSIAFPESLKRAVQGVIDGTKAMKRKGAERIPESFRKADEFLREMQAYVRSGGETTSQTRPRPAVPGKVNSSMTDEAYIIERPEVIVARSIKGGMPQNVAIKGEETKFAHFYIPDPDYPSLFSKGIRKDVKGDEHYIGVEANSGRIAHQTLGLNDEMYRIWGPEGITYGQKIHNSYPSGRPGETMWVGLDSPPTSAEMWRLGDSVLDEWSRNFFRIRMKVVDANAPVKIKATCGTVAEQFSKDIPGQYLPGGRRQALVRLPDETNAAIKKVADAYLEACSGYIAQMKKASEEFLKTGVKPAKPPVPPAPPKPWVDKQTGLKITIEPTGWVDANGHWGYGVRPDRQLINVKPLSEMAAHVSKTNDKIS